MEHKTVFWITVIQTHGLETKRVHGRRTLKNGYIEHYVTVNDESEVEAAEQQIQDYFTKNGKTKY